MLNAKEEKLWELIYNLHSNGENLSSKIKKYYDYWDGKYQAPGNSHFDDQEKTSCNIIKQILESKHNAILDAQFSIAVVPEVNVFADLNTIKEQQNYADILNSELENILKNNKFDEIKEKICRWGLISGIGAVQTSFNTSKNIEGEIVLDVIDPSTLNWDKNATKFEDLTFISYTIELNPVIAKKRYAVNPDGTYNIELCKKIDELSEHKKDFELGNERKRKGIVALQSDQTSDLAYVYDSDGIPSTKTIDLVVIFLLDDSVYIPDYNDTTSDKQIKEENIRKYPNGRIIVFSANKNKKLILEDKPAPEGFKNLGNIDIFRPLSLNNIYGKGEVEDLIATQDRINGTYLKLRELIANHINILLYFKGNNFEIAEGSFINTPVLGLEGTANAGLPFVLDNGSIGYAVQLKDYINNLKEEAIEISRLNPTMINGMRQPGTTSAEQVEALQESPMASIRSIQRNLKDTIIGIGNKIITLIQEYYSIQRLIKLSTGLYIDNQEVMYAKFSNREDQQYVQLLNEAAQTVREIKVDKNWKFKVDVIAGTEIPRSRRENANLVDKFVSMGLLNLQDPDIFELYLKSLDVPNYRAYISLMRRKKEESKNKPEPLNIIDIMKNPVIATAFSDIIKSLELNSRAKGQILQSVGLVPDIDKLEDAPIQSVTSKSELEDVSTIAPELISRDPVKAAAAQAISARIVTLEEANQ